MNKIEKFSAKKDNERQKSNPIFLLTTFVVISTITILWIKYPKETKRCANEIKELIQNWPNKIMNLNLR